MNRDWMDDLMWVALIAACAVIGFCVALAASI